MGNPEHLINVTLAYKDNHKYQASGTENAHVHSTSFMFFWKDADKIEATGSTHVNRAGESKTKHECRKESKHEGRKV